MLPTILHWTIIVLLVTEVLYTAWIIFCVCEPQCARPLGRKMRSMRPQDVMVRRMYALEFWIAFGILVVYLTMTYG